MPRLRNLALILAIVGLSGRTAGASAITYKAEEVVVDGLPVYSGLNATLPDLAAGGSVTIGGFAYDNSKLPGLDSSQPISGGIGFLIQGYNSSGNAVGPLIDVDGHYQGTLTILGPPERESAFFTGIVTRVGSYFGDPVPEALQDLAKNPGRMQISSLVSIGASGDTLESVVLTIAPATAPEPSTLVTMLSAVSLAFLARKRLRRS